MYDQEDMSICQNCHKPTPSSEMLWTYDRYHIPFQKVCSDCYEEVDAQIKEWIFDEGYAGESLEED